MISKVLRRNLSPSQITGYALANLVGLLIVLGAVQFYRDLTAVSGDPDSFISHDYLIISKKMKGLAAPGPFSREEIDDLRSQEWTSSVGAFTAADFNVAASLNLGGASSMSTTLFFESIPDEFFDISPKGWDYDPAEGRPVPIVISKDYLTLYNFGYAGTRGMPQLSEELISQVPLRLSLSGNGRQQWMDARIVGFSSRLNTIAVPSAFMQWANSQFGSGKAPDPQRLIIKLMRAGDPAATAYLEEHGYEPAGDRAASGKAAYFLTMVTAVVVGVGALISLLAIFILVLSVYLVLQKNRDKIHDLLLLGYTPGSISRVYIIMIGSVNLLVFAISAVALVAATHAWEGALEKLDASGAPVWPTMLLGLAITAVITLAGAIAVTRKVRKSFR